MKPTGLSESQLVDLLSGRLQTSFQRLQARMDEGGPDALADALPELGQEIAKAVAAAIQANNAKLAEQVEQANAQVRVSSTQFYDQLSASIDGY